MLGNPTIPTRIIRLAILTAAGLLAAYACGYATIGAMAVYACFLLINSNTLKACRALAKKRLLLVFICIPITISVIFVLSTTSLPAMARLSAAALICVPILLTINYQFKLGFSEVSQIVTVAILISTFESNNTYFLLRMFFITFGLAVAYVEFAYIFPLRYDKAFEEARAMLRTSLMKLNDVLFQKDGECDVSGVYAETVQLFELTKKYLAIICEDVDIKPQYSAYRGKTAALGADVEFIGTSLALIEKIISEKIIAGKDRCLCSPDCRDYVMGELRLMWARHLKAAPASGDAPRHKVEPWNAAILRGVRTELDFEMVYLLNACKKSES